MRKIDLGLQKNTLTHIFRSLVTTVPGFGVALERLLFRSDFDGPNNRELLNAIKELKIYVSNDIQHTDIEKQNLNLEHYEPEDIQSCAKSFVDEIKQEQLKIFKKIKSRLNTDLTKCLNNKALEQLKTDIESRTSINKKITLSFSLPPFISHLHVSLIKTALLLASAGFSINILLLDMPYHKLAFSRESDWPSKNYALWKFANYVELAPYQFKFSSSVLKNVNIIVQSMLYKEGFNFNRNFIRFRESLLLSNEVIQSTKETSINNKSSEGELSFIETHVLDYYISLSILNSHYLLIGPDKKNLWLQFEKACSEVLNSSATWFLVNSDVPSSTGNKISLDNDMCFIDKQFSSTRCTKEFAEWFAEDLLDKEKEGCNYEPGYEKEIKKYFKSINKISDKTSKKNNQIQLALSSLESKEILGCYCFGGCTGIKDDTFFNKNETYNTNYRKGDIDLIFIVENKTPEIAHQIHKKLSKYGDVIYHPDFYSKRTTDYIPIEVIVLPKESSYFSSQGILTGLSALNSENVYTVFGNPLNTIISTPNINDYKKYNSRKKIYYTCHYGINHIQSELFTSLVQVKPYIDYSRLIKFIAMDYCWVLTGKFYRDLDEIESTLLKCKSFQSASIIEDFNSSAMQNSDDNTLVDMAYSLCTAIRFDLNLRNNKGYIDDDLQKTQTTRGPARATI